MIPKEVTMTLQEALRDEEVKHELFAFWRSRVSDVNLDFFDGHEDRDWTREPEFNKRIVHAVFDVTVRSELDAGQEEVRAENCVVHEHEGAFYVFTVGLYDDADGEHEIATLGRKDAKMLVDRLIEFGADGEEFDFAAVDESDVFSFFTVVEREMRLTFDGTWEADGVDLTYIWEDEEDAETYIQESYHGHPFCITRCYWLRDWHPTHFDILEACGFIIAEFESTKVKETVAGFDGTAQSPEDCVVAACVLWHQRCSHVCRTRDGRAVTFREQLETTTSLALAAEPGSHFL